MTVDVLHKKSLNSKNLNLDNSVFKSLIIELIIGMAMYAHRSKQLNSSDKQVDEFATKTLDELINRECDNHLRLCELFDEALKMRSRSKSLYNWSCEPISVVPEMLSGPATFLETDDLDKGKVEIETFLNEQKFKLPVVADLEQRCIKAVSTTVDNAEFASQQGIDNEYCYAFFFAMLDSLTMNLSVAELRKIVLKAEEVSKEVYIMRARESKHGLFETVNSEIVKTTRIINLY